MSEAISQHQRELARSCYRGYITDYFLNQRVSGNLAERAERHLVRAIVLETLPERPTKAQLLEAFKDLIEQAESEWPSRVKLPPRPHGL